MKNWILILTAFLLWNCGGNNSSTAEVEGVDLTLYTVEDLSGTTAQRVIKYNADGVLLEEGFIKNGLKVGSWTSFYEDDGDIKMITTYVDGVPNGQSIKFDNSRRLNRVTGYKNGQFSGRVAKYSLNKVQEEFTYSDGVLNGTYKKYFESKDKIQMKANYKNGEQHGTTTYFNIGGEVVMRYEYKNGEKITGGIVEEPNTGAAEQ